MLLQWFVTLRVMCQRMVHWCLKKKTQQMTKNMRHDDKTMQKRREPVAHLLSGDIACIDSVKPAPVADTSVMPISMLISVNTTATS